MIDTKLLRQKLIDMAMRGLLVEQRQEEGNASDLLEEIRAEKAALIKKGQIKKEKPLPEIKEEEKPFAIPNSWCWVRLGEIGISQTGKTPPTNNDEFWGNDTPFITPGDILNGSISYTNRSVSFAGEEFSRVVLSGAILQVCIGGSIGKIGIVDRKICFNQQINAVTTVICNALYLYFAMQNESFTSILKRRACGTATPIINLSTWQLLPIPLPPLAEQKRIVAALEASLKLVDTIAKDSVDLDKALKFLRQKVLDMAMRGLLVEQRSEEGNASDLLEQIRTEKAALIKEGKIKKEKPLPEIKEEEKPFAIPDSWCWVRLGNLAESIQYGYNAPAQESGRIKMVRITDIQNNAVLWENVPYCDIDEFNINTYLIKENDILFARTGGTVGKSFLVRNVLEDAIYAGYLIRTRYGCKLSSTYMKLFMESSLYWSQLRNGTNATAQPNCNGQTLSKMLVPLPPLAEQKRIVAKLEQINALIDTMLN